MNAKQALRAPGGLTGRLVGVTLLCLLVIQLCVFVIVRHTITDQAQRQLAAELAVGERGWLRLLSQHAEKLREGATLLAADYGFRSAVSSGDVPTIESALDNHGQRIGAHVAALLGPDLTLRAATQGPMTRDSELQRIARLLAQQEQRQALALVGATPYQFVMVPVRAPTVVGWVLMGFPIGQALADDMRQLFAMHLAVLALAPEGPPQVTVSTLPGLDAAALARANSNRYEATTPNEVFETRLVNLPAVTGQVQTVLLRSYSEAMAPYERLQWVLALITVAGLLLFALVSSSAMRRVTRPLRRLQLAAHKLEQGQFDVPIQDDGRDDEVGRLARGFDTMRRSIATQQTEIRHLAYWDRLTGLPNREQ
ncbi:MAG TPA: cache domain-containing protein, partial [Macromonas sp.]|nr:cache domain-containing protein [Macromonas sp.]